jgi:molecular chaperone GrpE
MTNPNDTDGIIPEPEAGSTAPGTVEAELADARAKADENWTSYLRAVAEADNVRKRAQRDVEAASRYAIERFAAELLDVRDSLELGVAAGPGADNARLLEGMEATLRLLNKAFEKSGLGLLDPVGQPFNPEFHEAMATQPTADQAPGTVVAVVQKGYVLNGRLLRPARVLVAREPDPPAA